MVSSRRRPRLTVRHLALVLSWIAFTAVAAVVGLSAVQLAGGSAVQPVEEVVPAGGALPGEAVAGGGSDGAPADPGSASPSPDQTGPSPSAEPSEPTPEPSEPIPEPSPSGQQSGSQQPAGQEQPRDEQGSGAEGEEAAAGGERSGSAGAGRSTGDGAGADGDGEETAEEARPQPVSRTFRSAGGSVTVECRDRSISLQSYAPAGGFKVGGARDDGDVAVDFVKGRRTVTVAAYCSAAGEPVGQVAVRDAPPPAPAPAPAGDDDDDDGDDDVDDDGDDDGEDGDDDD